jgi:6-pyruvoyltetrahydropterin/6-carboxytetrahydropterin synthase
VRVNLSETFTFDAAHYVPCFAGIGHKCGRLHGHTWRVEIHVEGEVNPETAILVDYYDLHAAWAPIGEALDHRYLNEVEGLEKPTTEVIAAWIWERLKPSLPLLSKLVLYEGATARCEYRGEP